MNCYNHPYENAVAYCPDCGKSLCYSCAHAFSFPICSPCNANRKKKCFLEYSKSLLIGLILFTIGCSAGLVFGYIFMSTYFGYRFLYRRFPSFLLIGSLRTMLIYPFKNTYCCGCRTSDYAILYCSKRSYDNEMLSKIT